MARRTKEQVEAPPVTHPYAELQGTPLWKAVDKAVRDLVRNGDLDERTARSHIVGYITALVARAQHADEHKRPGPALRNALTKSRKAGKLLRDIEQSLAKAS